MKNTYIAIAILTAALTGCKTQNPILEIEGGKIQGVQTVTKGVYVYKGIPFAAAPVQMLASGDNYKKVFDWAGWDTLEKMRAASTMRRPIVKTQQ